MDYFQVKLLDHERCQFFIVTGYNLHGSWLVHLQAADAHSYRDGVWNLH